MYDVTQRSTIIAMSEKRTSSRKDNCKFWDLDGNKLGDNKLQNIKIGIRGEVFEEKLFVMEEKVQENLQEQKSGSRFPS